MVDTNEFYDGLSTEKHPPGRTCMFIGFSMIFPYKPSILSSIFIGFSMKKTPSILGYPMTLANPQHLRRETFWLMCAEVRCALAITEWYSLQKPPRFLKNRWGLHSYCLTAINGLSSWHIASVVGVRFFQFETVQGHRCKMSKMVKDCQNVKPPLCASCSASGNRT